MKRITIEIHDDYAGVLSVTASGYAGLTLNVTTCAVDLHKFNCIKFDEKGKSWFTNENEKNDK